MVRPARVQSSQQVALQLIRFDDIYWLPPLGRFVRRVWRRVGQRCRGSATSGVAIAHDAVRAAQQEDIATIAEAISLPARHCARKFQIEEHELANETLIEVLPTIRKRYKPPATLDEAEQRRALRNYVYTPVYRTAYKMRFGKAPRERRIESLLAEVEDQADVLSEIDMLDEYQRLMRFGGQTPEGRCRLQAIQHSKSVAEAARRLLITPDALRQWVWQLRQRLKD